LRIELDRLSNAGHDLDRIANSRSRLARLLAKAIWRGLRGRRRA
jgi:hypothetical protein